MQIIDFLKFLKFFKVIIKLLVYFDLFPYMCNISLILLIIPIHDEWRRFCRETVKANFPLGGVLSEVRFETVLFNLKFRTRTAFELETVLRWCNDAVNLTYLERYLERKIEIN